jgi:hypothetical protein
MPSLRTILQRPAVFPAKIETSLPKGLPSIANIMTKVAEQVPDLGATKSLSLPKIANIVASIEEHVPHPASMSAADLLQKLENPLTSRIEGALAGGDRPTPPAPTGIIKLIFD